MLYLCVLTELAKCNRKLIVIKLKHLCLLVCKHHKNKLSLDGWPDVLSYLAKDVIRYVNISDQGGLFFSYIAGGVKALGMVTDLTNIITSEVVCDQVCFYHANTIQVEEWNWCLGLVVGYQANTVPAELVCHRVSLYHLSHVLCIIITSNTRFGLAYNIKKSNSNKY